MRGAMTPKQQRFVAEYLIDLNATAAAQRAGYRDPNIGRQLITKNNVSAAIAAKQAAIASKLEIKSESVLSEIANLAYSDIGAILDFTGEQPKLKPANQITPEARRCIQSVKVKRTVEGKGDDAEVVEVVEFRLWDKGGRLQDLAKHLGLLVERHEHTGSAVLRIVEEIVEAPDADQK